MSSVADEERQKIITLYHKNPDWDWRKLAYEVYKEEFQAVWEKREKVIETTEVIETTYNYETAMKWYNEEKGDFINFEYWIGNTKMRTRSTDFPDPTSMKELYRAQVCKKAIKTRVFNEIVKPQIFEDEVPKKFIRRVKVCVGKHLMNVCRAEEACPFKALLPEYEPDIQEEERK